MMNLREMTEAEVAWLAGLFDGEGSIVLVNRKRPGSGSLRITVSNTCMLLLARIIDVTGVGRVSIHEHENPRHATSGTWALYGEPARELLRRMRPWMIVKADRTDAILSGNTFPRQDRWDSIYPTTSSS